MKPYMKAFRQGIGPLADQERLANQPPPSYVANLLACVYDATKMANDNGNRSVGIGIMALAAAKTMFPEMNIRLLSDAPKPDDYPTLRKLLKPVANWVRRKLDPSLTAPDPGANLRRNLMHASPYDANYGGHFSDPELRSVFLALVDLIENGEARAVLRGVIGHYAHMAQNRRPITPISGDIDETIALTLINRFVMGGGKRGQLAAWALAKAADPTVKPFRSFHSNDHGDDVADINGRTYGIEVTSNYIDLDKTQDTCLKARMSGVCERITMLTMRDQCFDANDSETTATIARQFPDIKVAYMTFSDYTSRMVNGVSVTWNDVTKRIGQGVQNLAIEDVAAWDALVSEIA